MFSTSDVSFIPHIKSCIATLCDTSASLQTVMRRALADPTGGELPDDAPQKVLQDFVHALCRVHEYCREFLDAELSDRISDWVQEIVISESPEAESVSAGLAISTDLQQYLFDIGMKDTQPKAEAFDFELYRGIISMNKREAGLPAPDDAGFDPLNPNLEISGFPGKSEYSFLYSNYVNKSFYLMSEGRVDAAREFFYNILSDFAPIFDLMFLDNCIRISGSIKGTRDEAEDVRETTESDYHMIYLLHKSEFARLMMRAGIHHQPDVIDNRAPAYAPAQKPAGINIR